MRVDCLSENLRTTLKVNINWSVLKSVGGELFCTDESNSDKYWVMKLAMKMSSACFANRDMVLSRGEPVTSLFILVEGAVRLLKIDSRLSAIQKLQSATSRLNDSARGDREIRYGDRDNDRVFGTPPPNGCKLSN